MKGLRCLGVLAICFFTVPCVHAQTKKITAAEAKDHIGDRATVCGKVASTHYAKSSKGEPTFLNLDEPYPKEIFTILIWDSDRGKFGTPEIEYKSLQVCVTGKITSYHGVPEIDKLKRSSFDIRSRSGGPSKGIKICKQIAQFRTARNLQPHNKSTNEIANSGLSSQN